TMSVALVTMPCLCASTMPRLTPGVRPKSSALTMRILAAVMLASARTASASVDHDVLEVAVFLVVVETVPHDEAVFDAEADVIHRDLHQPSGGLGKEAGDLQGARPPGPQHVEQVVEGQAGVHDVLDHQQVAAIQALVEVFDQLHLARRLRRGPV